MRLSRALLHATYWVPQKLPQIYTDIAYICIVCIEKVAGFAVIYGTRSILYGNSDIGAHVHRNISYMIWLGNKSSHKSDFFYFRKTFLIIRTTSNSEIEGRKESLENKECSFHKSTAVCVSTIMSVFPS